MGISTSVISEAEQDGARAFQSELEELEANPWAFLNTPLPPYANGGSHINITRDMLEIVDGLISDPVSVAQLMSELGDH